MILRATAVVCALVVLFGATRSTGAAPDAGVSDLVAKSDSIKAAGEARAKADSGLSPLAKARARDSASVRAVPPGRGSPFKGLRAPGDSLRPSDSASLADSARSADSTASKPRALPPRSLTLRQQVMFAGGFMTFVALMMASMQNFNP